MSTEVSRAFYSEMLGGQHRKTKPTYEGRSGTALRRVGDYTSKWRRSHCLEWPYTGFRNMEMQVNEREASLLDAFRRLPPDTAMELSALAKRLAELAPNQRIDWSDSWSDEDLNEFRAASLRRLDAEESEDQG